MNTVNSKLVSGLFLFGLVSASLAGEPINTYDAQGRVVSSQDASGKVEQYIYDNDGKRHTIDNKGHPTDAAGPDNTAQTGGQQASPKPQ
jgi:YD repeat-containing protein